MAPDQLTPEDKQKLLVIVEARNRLAAEQRRLNIEALLLNYRESEVLASYNMSPDDRADLGSNKIIRAPKSTEVSPEASPED